jgi:hypothetical protein
MIAPTMPGDRAMPQAQPTDIAKEQREPSALLELIRGKWVCQAIYVAAELGIADILKDGPRSAAEIASAAGASEDAVFRLLRALASVGLFSTLPDRCFALTPFGNYLRSDVPGSARAFARFAGHDFTWRPWGALTYSVRTGNPGFDHVFGMSAFQYLEKHSDVAGVFNDAMTSISFLEAQAIAAAYDFSGVDTLVEIGGGNGLLLATIVKANRDLHGVLLELPHAIERAPALFQREGVADRCRAMAGDFFESVPAGGDAYLIKKVIHDWDNERSHRILTKCREVMKPGNKLLIIERMLAAGDEPDPTKFFDLEMLILTAGGRERSEAEFRELFAGAGFELTRIVRTSSAMSIIEGVTL